jgi:hypothetical protein
VRKVWRAGASQGEPYSATVAFLSSTPPKYRSIQVVFGSYGDLFPVCNYGPMVEK